jgi:hypothetical protein
LTNVNGDISDPKKTISDKAKRWGGGGGGSCFFLFAVSYNIVLFFISP